MNLHVLQVDDYAYVDPYGYVSVYVVVDKTTGKWFSPPYEDEQDAVSCMEYLIEHFLFE